MLFLNRRKAAAGTVPAVFLMPGHEAGLPVRASGLVRYRIYLVRYKIYLGRYRIYLGRYRIYLDRYKMYLGRYKIYLGSFAPSGLRVALLPPLCRVFSENADVRQSRTLQMLVPAGMTAFFLITMILSATYAPGTAAYSPLGYVLPLTPIWQ